MCFLPGEGWGKSRNNQINQRGNSKSNKSWAEMRGGSTDHTKGHPGEERSQGGLLWEEDLQRGRYDTNRRPNERGGNRRGQGAERRQFDFNLARDKFDLLSGANGEGFVCFGS